MARSAFGHLSKLPSGNWQARWRDEKGKTHSKTHPSQRLASSWLASERVALEQGAVVDRQSGKITLAEFAESWKRSGTIDLRPSTAERDCGYVDWYVKVGPLAERQIRDIEPEDVDDWVLWLTADKGKAPATVRKAYQILSKIFRKAVRDKRIPRSPCLDIKLPKVARKEQLFASPEQVYALADAIDPNYRALVFLGCFGGLRIGEMLGLTVGDVDTGAGTVRVRQTLTKTGGHKTIGPPKTETSRRVVTVPPLVIEALRPHLKAKPASAYVFTAPQGGLVGYTNFRRRVWAPAVAAAGLPAGFRIHDMRHTASSFWQAQGAHPLRSARMGGHASAAAFVDLYGHIQEGEDVLTARLEAMGRAVEAARSEA